MQVSYDPTAKSGQQYSIRLPDGRHVEHVGRMVVEGLLKREGLSVREALAVLADARLAAAT
jgi:hypothetical protein